MHLPGLVKDILDDFERDKTLLMTTPCMTNSIRRLPEKALQVYRLRANVFQILTSTINKVVRLTQLYVN